LICISMYI